MGQPGVPEAERLGGRRRDVDHPSGDERPPIDDPEDDGTAVVEIEDANLRSHRQAAMRGGQSLGAIERRQAQLRRRSAAHAKSDRADNNKCSHSRLASRASPARSPPQLKHKINQLANLSAIRAPRQAGPVRSTRPSAADPQPQSARRASRCRLGVSARLRSRPTPPPRPAPASPPRACWPSAWRRSCGRRRRGRA